MNFLWTNFFQENIPEVRFDPHVTTYNRASCEVRIILISTIVNIVITTIIMHTSAIIINVFSLKENSLEPKFREVYSFGTISRVSVYIAAMRPSCFYRRKSCNINVIQQDFERGVFQSGAKPNLVATILATSFGVFFCNICNVFKNMFNVPLIIMW